MQIHELPAGTLADADVVAVDNGSSTRKLTFKTVVESLIAAGITALQSAIANINALIGSTALPTTDKTITGAIAEHESDISNINDNLTAVSFGLTRDTTNISAGSGRGIHDKASKTVRISFYFSNAENISASATLFTVPSEYCPSSEMTGYGIVRTSSDVPLPTIYRLSASGMVSQPSTNAARGGFGFIEYRLG